MCLCVSRCVCDPLNFHVVCMYVSVTPSTCMLYVRMCLCVPLCLCDPLHFHVVCLRVCPCGSVCLWSSNFIRIVYRHGGEGVLSEVWVPAKVIVWQISEVGKTMVRSGRECLQSQQPVLTSCGESVWGVNRELQMAKVECGERVGRARGGLLGRKHAPCWAWRSVMRTQRSNPRICGGWLFILGPSMCKGLHN